MERKEEWTGEEKEGAKKAETEAEELQQYTKKRRGAERGAAAGQGGSESPAPEPYTVSCQLTHPLTLLHSALSAGNPAHTLFVLIVCILLRLSTLVWPLRRRQPRESRKVWNKHQKVIPRAHLPHTALIVVVLLAAIVLTSHAMAAV